MKPPPDWTEHGSTINHWINTKPEKILKHKYDQQICVRINDKLRQAINYICDDTNVNTADYIRSGFFSSAKYVAQILSQIREDFMVA